MARFVDTAEFAKMQPKFLPGNAYSSFSRNLLPTRIRDE